MYYFDNAATTAQKPPAVAQAVYEALHSGELGNPSRGTHAYAMQAYRRVLAVKEDVKRLFHASDDYEVAFTYNSTTALNMVLKGVLQPGDHVLTTTWEHNAVLRPLYQLEKQGVSVDYIGSDALTGQLHYDELEKKYRPNTAYLVCNHASNVTGNVLDLQRIKLFCQTHHIGLIVDVSQTAGAYPIDISDGIVTALCFTGHKSLYGPGGTGGICIRRDTAVQPYLTGGDGIHSFEHEQPCQIPTVFEAGTMNVAGIMGLGAGIRLVLQDSLAQRMQHQQTLADIFVSGVQHIPHITLYGDFTKPHVGVYALNIGDADAAVVSDALWTDYGMAVRAGFHCAPLMHKALHTEVQGAVRFSFSCFTTEDDAAAAVQALRALAAR